MTISNITQRQWYKRFKRSEFVGTHNNAMFKGVSFIIDGDEITSGRRTIEHQFPQRDIPYSEDIGRSVRIFDVNGILLGDDYLEQRDNLLFACEESGPGEFVHPYYGILEVICKNIQIANNVTETRMCRFTLTLVESGKLTFPIVTSDTKSEVEDKVETSLAETKNAFLDVYNKVKKQIIYLDGKRAILTEALNSINTAKSIAGMPSSYFSSLNTSIAQIDSLVLNGEDLIDTIINLTTFGLLGDTLDNLVDLVLSFEGLKNLMNFSGSTVITSDDTEAIQEAIQLSSVITMGLLISQITLVSSADAIYYRDTMLNKLDTLIESDLSDALMQSLRDLRAAISLDIDERALNLPDITSYMLINSTPAIVLSHTLYGSIDQEQDILDRNKIIHPGFLPGGVSLEVLLNA